VADYSYVATAHAVVYCGATPRFADVDLETGTVDPDSVSRMITPRTKLILAVDALGMPADWRALEDIARNRGVGLVADTACSAGATAGSRPAGSYGDAAVFSLHARKGITCGEGGVIVVTDDDALAANVRSRAAFGVGSALDRSASSEFRPPEFLRLGYNYKLSDVLAAIANVQLQRLPELIAERRRLASHYGDLLAGVPEVAPPVEPEGRQSAWQTYAVRLEAGIDRDVVVTAMRARGIECNVGTFSLSRQRLYASDDSCPRSWYLADQHLAIPLFPGLSADEQSRVVEALTEVVSLARISR
jgi:dTDP-4-amino-4,6-dideoxygalactose transaminase